jgi:uncharacterized CHY-type Zn-finger protein
VNIYGKQVYGAEDEETRCSHYHQETDRIALKCFCCREYYPCYKCHEEITGKPFKPWPAEYREEKAVLCGACGTELTISGYLTSSSRCPSCRSAFNPGCALHYHLYFEPKK